MSIVENIIKFCNTYNNTYWQLLPYEVKQLFIISSEYVLRYHVGNEKLAKFVTNLKVKGKVTIARLSGRGKKWPLPPDGYKNINVTSGSANKIDGYNIKLLSPMFLGPINKTVWPMIGDDSCLVFENYWQYSKIFPDMGHLNSDGKVTEKWYIWRKKGFNKIKGQRHPDGTKTNEIRYVDDQGRNWYRYRVAISSLYGNDRMDYIESRKKVYVPLYYNLISKQSSFIALKEAVRNGLDVQLLDFDAPETSTEITLDLLKKSVNETSPGGKPFGHGYIIGAALLDINPCDFT